MSYSSYNSRMPIPNDKAKRWRPQVRLSTTFLVTAVIAVCVAWWCDHSQLRREVERLTQPTSVTGYTPLDEFDKQFIDIQFSSGSFRASYK